MRGVEETPVHRAGSGARSAMQEYDRHTVALPRYFPIHLVATVEPEIAGLMRLYIGIKFGTDSWCCKVHAIGPGGFLSNPNKHASRSRTVTARQARCEVRAGAPGNLFPTVSAERC